MITEEYINQIVNGCTIDDFTVDKMGVVRTDGLPEYIDNIINEIISNIEENTETLMQNKCLYEVQKSITDENISKLALFFDFSMSSYNYIIRHYYIENMFNSVISRIVSNAISQYQAILSGYLSGNYTSVIAQVRILYENYVSYCFIKKYPILSEAFKDHAEITKLRLLKEFGGKLSDEENNSYIQYIEKYGEGFEDDYGWTKSILKSKNKRKLITLVKDVELTDYNSLYRISSNFIHPSSFSVYYNNIKQIPISAHFTTSSVELVTNHIIQFMRDFNCIEKDRVIIMNVLYGLREELYNEPRYQEK